MCVQTQTHDSQPNNFESSEIKHFVLVHVTDIQLQTSPQLWDVMCWNPYKAIYLKLFGQIFMSVQHRCFAACLLHITQPLHNFSLHSASTCLSNLPHWSWQDLSNHTFSHDWKSNKNSNLPKTRKWLFRLCPNVCRCLCSDCLHPCPCFRHVENHAQGRGQTTTPSGKWEKLLAAESWSMCFTFAYLLANVKLGTHLAVQRKVGCYIWTCFIRK